MKKQLLLKSFIILLFATTLMANGQTVSFTTWPTQTPFCGSWSCATFINTSTVNPTSWLWNFAGDTSTYPTNLWVCFDTVGTFPVSLTAYTDTYIIMDSTLYIESDSITTVQYITVLPLINATVTQSHDTLYSSTDSSYVSYRWDDSLTDTWITTSNPYLVINNPGNYYLAITTTNGCTAEGFIIADCGAAFTLAADTTQLHHYITTNLAEGHDPMQYDWNWGDGTPDDTIPYPSHIYANAGFYTICLSITDSKGCQSTYCDSGFAAMRTTNTMVYVNVVNPTLVTGTQPINMQTPQVTISPNPASDQLLINGSWKETGNWKLTIVNTLGQTIYTEELNPPKGGSAFVNCKPFPSGIYFLEMQNETERWVGRFVKE